MKKLNLFSIELVLLFLVAIPSVTAAPITDLFNRVQVLISNLPFYEQALTFIALLILFLAVFRVGGTKMSQTFNWGEDSNNANTAISVTLALIATVSSYVFLNSKGIYIFHPILSKIFLMVLIGLVIYRVISIIKTDGELGGLGKFFIAVGIVAGYHLIKWLFFTNFPDNLGEVLAIIVYVIYGAAILYMIIAIFGFLRDEIRDGGDGGRDRDRDRNRDRDDGGDEPDDGDDGGGDEPEESYSTEIGQLEDLINRLTERYARLKELGSQIHELLERSREHPYEHNEDGGIPVELVSEFNEIVDAINQIIGSINTIITNLGNVRDKIPREESNRLSTLMEQFAELSVEISEYVRNIREELSGE